MRRRFSALAGIAPEAGTNDNPPPPEQREAGEQLTAGFIYRFEYLCPSLRTDRVLVGERMIKQHVEHLERHGAIERQSALRH